MVFVSHLWERAGRAGAMWALVDVEDRKTREQHENHGARKADRQVMPQKATSLIAAGTKRLIRTSGDRWRVHARGDFFQRWCSELFVDGVRCD